MRQEFLQHGQFSISDFLIESVANESYRELSELPKKNWIKQKDKIKGDFSISYSYSRYPLLWKSPVLKCSSKIFSAGQKKYKKVVQKSLQKKTRAANHANLLKIAEVFESKAFKDIIRQITGLKKLPYLMINATEFNLKDHITVHSDVAGLAFSLNLTKKWKKSWGGELIFFDRSGTEQKQEYTPKFNQLVFFKTPKNHLVSTVKVKKSRFVTSGWYFKTV